MKWRRLHLPSFMLGALTYCIGSVVGETIYYLSHR